MDDVEVIGPPALVEPMPDLVCGVDVSRLTPEKMREVLRRLAARGPADPQTIRDRVLLARRVDRLERENAMLRRQLVNTTADVAALALGPSTSGDTIVDFIDDDEDEEN